MKHFAAILLILGGLILALPQIYELLTDFTGFPHLQVSIGILSIVFGIAFLFKK